MGLHNQVRDPLWEKEFHSRKRLCYVMVNCLFNVEIYWEISTPPCYKRKHGQKSIYITKNFIDFCFYISKEYDDWVFGNLRENRRSQSKLDVSAK